MDIEIFEQLRDLELITDDVLSNIKSKEDKRPVSLHWELKMLMYTSIVLLTTGLGILVYKNLYSIGPLVITVFLALATTLCFVYCFKTAAPFSLTKRASAKVVRDYVLLLACLLLLTLTGYLQANYQIFGDRWEMATFVPMIILFMTAYYFDHIGILSLAIVNLAAWAGITVTPLHMLRDNDFSDSSIIYTGFVLGFLLITMALISTTKNIKPHFRLTYKNFGSHILFLSAVAAVIHFDSIYLIYLFILAAISYLQFVWAKKERSFYFLVITTLYLYTGVSYVFMHLLFSHTLEDTQLYVAFLYFIISGLALVFFLIRYNKIFKRI